MRKTHKNNNSITCDTMYTIQTSKTMIGYTDIMKKTMTNKTTTSFSALKNRNYTRKVYSLDNSVNYYRPILNKQKGKVYFAMQKTKQVKYKKEDAMHKSVSIENVALSTECASDEINTRIDTQNLISSALSKLDDRRKKIIQMRFAIGYDREHTPTEIAKQFNLSPRRIADIVNSALHKMKKTHMRQFVHYTNV